MFFAPLWLPIVMLIGSCGLLYVAGELIVRNLIILSRHYRLSAFVVAFFVMAVAASLPNAFVGLTSALQGIPELSLGDVMGNNLVALTVAVSVSVFFSQTKQIPVKGKTITTTSIFMVVAAILPLILIIDGTLTRIDGACLLLLFTGYLYWLFSGEDNFSSRDDEVDNFYEKAVVFSSRHAFKIILGVFLLLIAANGAVFSAKGLAMALNIPLVLVGILIVGLGSGLPQVYFAFSSARKGQTSMIMGNIMGSVILPSSLVLGFVSLIHPISTDGLELFAVSRVFLILITLLFLLFSLTSKVITRREGAMLIGAYLIFVVVVLYGI